MSVGSQFPSIEPEESLTKAIDFDLWYMLTCASILAHSDNWTHQDAALRIAQYCIQRPSGTPSQKDGAALVLDALCNQTAIQLAEKRRLIESWYGNRLSLGALLESTNRKIGHTIQLSDGKTIIANNFQLAFWEEARKCMWISASAPTSVGKSFILESWIQDYLAVNENSLVVYLVPTRALISEVARELKVRLPADRVNIASLPLAKYYKAGTSNVFIFTQERLHIFLNTFEDKPKIDALIVDEAHKIGDRHRGVFLQQVIELASEENPDLKIIFASPFTDNPELLLQDAPSWAGGTVKSSDITVNQNLIWVEQEPRKPTKWRVQLCMREGKVDLGRITLKSAPTPESKRLPFVAYSISQNESWNIVYVNGAADAEKAATQLFDCLNDHPEFEQDEEVSALIELCEKTIHKKFLLNRFLKRGVAFHYGNMPLIIREEIERLFSANKIKYLVCTSTLIEGVNMSCKNIFLRGPRKGKTSQMGPEDFWNLAWRAGRWWKEFQWNVICVDSDNDKVWGASGPPTKKSWIKIRRTADEVISNAETLVAYIESSDHFALSGSNPELEHVFSYLCVAKRRYGRLINCPFLQRNEASVLEKLDGSIGNVFEKITFPLEIIERNPGISPLLMESLLKRFESRPDRPNEDLLLWDPGSQDILDTYVMAFGRISEHLSQKLGFTSKQVYVNALLVVKWISWHQLSRLITDRIDYYAKKEPWKDNIAATIRSVMKDVEEIARYQAPRLLSCYIDLLRFHLWKIWRSDLLGELKDVSVYLELWLSQQTQISLAGLWLSRTAAVMLSELIASDDLNEDQCLVWLTNNDWKEFGLPILVKLEIEKVLGR